MALNTRIKILSSWCASSAEVANSVFPHLVGCVRTQDDREWREMLKKIKASRLLRILTMVRSQGQLEPLDLARLGFAGGSILWDGALIGELFTYFKTILPHEAQMRVAYDVFYDRFSAFIGQYYRATTLHQSDFDLQVFVPGIQTFDVKEAWEAFVRVTFSGAELKRNFAQLVNTVKMTDKGFSALDLPLLSQDQALFLAAFYLVNLESLQKGDIRRQNEMATLKWDLDGAGDKDSERIEKKIAKLVDELETRQQRYGPLYQQVEVLQKAHPEWIAQVRRVARSTFTPVAGTQIAKATRKIGTCVAQLEGLASLTESQLDRLPILITTEPPFSGTRAGGDSGGRACYSCGRALGKEDKPYSANKFIFESPSQRLQSGGSQTQPRVCGACAAVSFVSPVKLGGGRLVVRIGRKESQGEYLLEEQLRMLVLGEMNIVAGRYAMLQAREHRWQTHLG